MTRQAQERRTIQHYVGVARRARNAHLPRYVFIHINKTGGSSIEQALGLRFEHKTALDKRAELGARAWQRTFKFAFVRNPWNRAISHYRYRMQTNQTGLGDGHLAFRDWVKAVYRDRNPRYRDQELMFQDQWYWLSDDSGACMVDFIGRFESLPADFASLARILGVRGALPHLKRSETPPRADYYDAESQEIVARYFSTDIEKFGYWYVESSVSPVPDMSRSGHGTGRPAATWIDR